MITSSSGGGNSSRGGGDMLFACSRCYSRHPFEELSSGQQLCKVRFYLHHHFNYDSLTFFNLPFNRSAEASTPS